jgi:hypothetical protein
MQSNVKELVKLGVFPKSEDALKDPNGIEYIDNIQALIDNITLPISNDDAVGLCSILRNDDDDYFGLTQTLLQKIETAPSWPIKGLFTDSNNYWMGVLKSRARFIW